MARIDDNPRAALRAEIDTPNVARITTPNLPSYAEACHESQYDFYRAEAVRRVEMSARVNKQMSVEIGFVERLVMFWTNHFAMTVKKGDTVIGTIGQWERDVVRRHVLGRFGDMLRGTVQHPAMIAYLDNDDSMGPNSPTGLSWGEGFNENLAREILELHTVGSRGGYTEADVTAFSKILTGWSYVRGWEADNNWNGGNNTNRGRFIYRADWHEPGAIEVMGKTYPAVGQQQAMMVLNDLAVHPETAEHIAFKLVRHFIADEPTPAMVNPIKQRFIETRGNLKAVALALLDLPAAWSAPLTKIRTPYEMTIAQYRALGRRYKNSEPWALSEPLYALHNMAWEPPSPEGFSDETPDWLNPDALRIRLDVAQFHVWHIAAGVKRDPVALADNLFQSALSQETRARLAKAYSHDEALIILFTCPEFQRR
jgi:uncharacterized protein (DUF1800 family)